MFGEKCASDFPIPVRSVLLKIAVDLPGPSNSSQNLEDGPTSTEFIP